MNVTLVKVAAVAIAGFVVLFGGLYLAGFFGVPSVEEMDNAWGEVDQETVQVDTDLTIDNPNPLGLGGGVSSVDYNLTMNEVELAEGTADELDVPAGRSTTNLSTDVQVDQIPEWWASHVQAGEHSELDIDAVVDANVGPIASSPSITRSETIETDIESTLAASMAELEGTHEGPDLFLETVDVTIEDTDARWGNVTVNETQVLLDFTIHNPNQYFPVPVPTMEGDIQFNDVTIADWDAADVEVVEAPDDRVIPVGETRDITLGLTIDNDNIATWFPTHVAAQERSDARIGGQLAIDVQGQTFLIPPEDDAFACTFDLQTAILVEQDSGVADRECTFSGFENRAGPAVSDGAWALSPSTGLADWPAGGYATGPSRAGTDLADQGSEARPSSTSSMSVGQTANA